MLKIVSKTALCSLLLLLTINAGAATRYVTSEWQVGLHADKLVTSPILKLVSIGTALEVVKTEDSTSFVRTPDGIEGWVDNSYLVDQPTTAVPAVSSATDAGVTQDTSLEQQLKSERVRTGELQVELAELRKHLGQANDDKSLYEKIDQLAMEKKELEVQLAKILEGTVPEAAGVPPGPDPDSFYNFRNLLISLVVALIAGVIGGLYLMDFIYRRRHGGFRI
jgi:hypothetical protein